MRLESIREAVATEFKKIDKTEKKAAEVRPKAVVKDSARLSEQATKAAPETKSIAARIAIEPEIREEKIAEVKSRIESGYYNSNEFNEKLADKLIKDFGF